MTNALTKLFTQPSDDVYTVFQTETDVLGSTETEVQATPKRRLGTFGFFGRMLEGTGIVAFSLALAILTMTTGARAETTSMLSSATGDHGSLMMVIMVTVFAGMLALLGKTWRQTGKTIHAAPRRSYRIT